MNNAILSTPEKQYEHIAHASNEVAGRLAARLAEETQGEVLFTPADRGRYATDASIYQVIPLGVFVPRDTQEVSIAMDICRDLGVPIVPRGGGTSQCGQTVGAGLVMVGSYAMYPTSSVSGFFFAHPESSYFGLGKIGPDQVASYADRKGISLEAAERLLSPNLAYSPSPKPISSPSLVNATL